MVSRQVPDVALFTEDIQILRNLLEASVCFVPEKYRTMFTEYISKSPLQSLKITFFCILSMVPEIKSWVAVPADAFYVNLRGSDGFFVHLEQARVDWMGRGCLSTEKFLSDIFDATLYRYSM